MLLAVRLNAELGAAPTTKLNKPRSALHPKLRQPANNEGRWPEPERGRGLAEP